MRQLLSAICYCHKQGIVHRDLKPENILIDSDDPDKKLSIKVIDFGMAGWFTADSKLIQAMGTPYYVAPEVLEHNYNEKCDVWSCGVILHVLLSGRYPFRGKIEDMLKTMRATKLTFAGIFFFHILHQ